MGCLNRTSPTTTRKQLISDADAATRAACEAAKLLKQHGLDSKLSTEAQDWVKQHEQWDAERELPIAA